jgi:hypothetical protein
MSDSLVDPNWFGAGVVRIAEIKLNSSLQLPDWPFSGQIQIAP